MININLKFQLWIAVMLQICITHSTVMPWGKVKGRKFHNPLPAPSSNLQQRKVLKQVLGARLSLLFFSWIFMLTCQLSPISYVVLVFFFFGGAGVGGGGPLNSDSLRNHCRKWSDSELTNYELTFNARGFNSL